MIRPEPFIEPCDRMQRGNRRDLVHKGGSGNDQTDIVLFNEPKDLPEPEWTGIEDTTQSFSLGSVTVGRPDCLQGELVAEVVVL